MEKVVVDKAVASKRIESFGLLSFVNEIGYSRLIRFLENSKARKEEIDAVKSVLKKMGFQTDNEESVEGEGYGFNDDFAILLNGILECCREYLPFSKEVSGLEDFCYKRIIPKITPDDLVINMRAYNPLDKSDVQCISKSLGLKCMFVESCKSINHPILEMDREGYGEMIGTSFRYPGELEDAHLKSSTVIKRLCATCIIHYTHKFSVCDQSTKAAMKNVACKLNPFIISMSPEVNGLHQDDVTVDNIFMESPFPREDSIMAPCYVLKSENYRVVHLAVEDMNPVTIPGDAIISLCPLWHLHLSRSLTSGFSDTVMKPGVFNTDRIKSITEEQEEEEEEEEEKLDRKRKRLDDNDDNKEENKKRSNNDPSSFFKFLSGTKDDPCGSRWILTSGQIKNIESRPSPDLKKMLWLLDSYQNVLIKTRDLIKSSTLFESKIFINCVMRCPIACMKDFDPQDKTQYLTIFMSGDLSAENNDENCYPHHKFGESYSHYWALMASVNFILCLKGSARMILSIDTKTAEHIDIIFRKLTPLFHLCRLRNEVLNDKEIEILVTGSPMGWIHPDRVCIPPTLDTSSGETREYQIPMKSVTLRTSPACSRSVSELAWKHIQKNELGECVFERHLLAIMSPLLLGEKASYEKMLKEIMSPHSLATSTVVASILLETDGDPVRGDILHRSISAMESLLPMRGILDVMKDNPDECHYMVGIGLRLHLMMIAENQLNEEIEERKNVEPRKKNSLRRISGDFGFQNGCRLPYPSILMDTWHPCYDQCKERLDPLFHHDQRTNVIDRISSLASRTCLPLPNSINACDVDDDVDCMDYALGMLGYFKKIKDGHYELHDNLQPRVYDERQSPFNFTIGNGEWHNGSVAQRWANACTSSHDTSSLEMEFKVPHPREFRNRIADIEISPGKDEDGEVRYSDLRESINRFFNLHLRALTCAMSMGSPKDSVLVHTKWRPLEIGKWFESGIPEVSKMCMPSTREDYPSLADMNDCNSESWWIPSEEMLPSGVDELSALLQNTRIQEKGKSIECGSMCRIMRSQLSVLEDGRRLDSQTYHYCSSEIIWLRSLMRTFLCGGFKSQTRDHLPNPRMSVRIDSLFRDCSRSNTQMLMDWIDRQVAICELAMLLYIKSIMDKTPHLWVAMEERMLDAHAFFECVENIAASITPLMGEIQKWIELKNDDKNFDYSESSDDSKRFPLLARDIKRFSHAGKNDKRNVILERRVNSEGRESVFSRDFYAFDILSKRIRMELNFVGQLGVRPMSPNAFTFAVVDDMESRRWSNGVDDACIWITPNTETSTLMRRMLNIRKMAPPKITLNAFSSWEYLCCGGSSLVCQSFLDAQIKYRMGFYSHSDLRPMTRTCAQTGEIMLTLSYLRALCSIGSIRTVVGASPFQRIPTPNTQDLAISSFSLAWKDAASKSIIVNNKMQYAENKHLVVWELTQRLGIVYSGEVYRKDGLMVTLHRDRYKIDIHSHEILSRKKAEQELQVNKTTEEDSGAPGGDGDVIGKKKRKREDRDDEKQRKQKDEERRKRLKGFTGQEHGHGHGSEILEGSWEEIIQKSPARRFRPFQMRMLPIDSTITSKDYHPRSEFFFRQGFDENFLQEGSEAPLLSLRDVRQNSINHMPFEEPSIRHTKRDAQLSKVASHEKNVGSLSRHNRRIRISYRNVETRAGRKRIQIPFKINNRSRGSVYEDSEGPVPANEANRLITISDRTHHPTSEETLFLKKVSRIVRCNYCNNPFSPRWWSISGSWDGFWCGGKSCPLSAPIPPTLMLPCALCKKPVPYQDCIMKNGLFSGDIGINPKGSPIAASEDIDASSLVFRIPSLLTGRMTTQVICEGKCRSDRRVLPYIHRMTAENLASASSHPGFTSSWLS